MLQIITLLKTWVLATLCPFETTPRECFSLLFWWLWHQDLGKHKQKEHCKLYLLSLCLGLWQGLLMTLGTAVLHSSGLWTDTPRADEDWDRDPPFLALPFSKPPVPTVREHIPGSAEAAGKHPVLNTQECRAMSENHPVSRTLNVIRSLLQQLCQVVALLLLNTATFRDNLFQILTALTSKTSFL